MKFTLPMVIIFINYGSFSYSQPSDDGYHDEKIKDSVDYIMETSTWRPSVIHETTVDALRLMSHVSNEKSKMQVLDGKLEMQFKKTAICLHYTAYDFLEKLGNIIISMENYHNTGTGKEVRKNITYIHKNYFKFVDKIFPNVWKTHIRYDDNTFNFHLDTLFNVVIGAANIVSDLWLNFGGLPLLEVVQLVEKLSLDLVMNCEVPVSYFIEYSSSRGKPFERLQYFPYAENVSDGIEITEPLPKFNAWNVLAYNDSGNIKGGLDCYISRLYFLFSLLDKEANQLIWDEDTIDSIQMIVRIDWSENEDGELIISTDELYVTNWRKINNHAVKIVNFLFKNIKAKSYTEEMRENLENVIEFYDHSLLECKVPTYLFLRTENETNVRNSLRKNFKKTFGNFKRDSMFFDNYPPYTFDCFKQSMINMMNEIAELDTNFECYKKKFLTKVSKIYEYKKGKGPLNIVHEIYKDKKGKAPLIEEVDEEDEADSYQTDQFYETYGTSDNEMDEEEEEREAEKRHNGRNIMDLENIGTSILNEFVDRLLESGEYSASSALAVANVLSRFQNFYQSCGASNNMMNVYWKELGLP